MERWLTVVLQTGHDVPTVRDKAVSEHLVDKNPSWLADQLVQETIGVDLAMEGWEVIGEDRAEDLAGEGGIGRSSTWIVRRA